MDLNEKLKAEAQALGYDTGDFVCVSYQAVGSGGPVTIFRRGVQVFLGEGARYIPKGFTGIAHDLNVDTNSFAITQVNNRYLVEIAATYAASEELEPFHDEG